MKFFQSGWQYGSTLVAMVTAVIPLLLAGAVSPAIAASSVQTLIADAERNTNTVNTLIHNDEHTVTTPTLSVKVIAHGSEDELRNREQDYESVSVTSRGSGGKAKSLHYTVDIIFMNGTTYYRTSLQKNKWKTHKGMTFPDPFAGGWKRGRTTVSFPKTFKFQQVGTGGSETHVRASFSSATTAETVDLWISSGSKPYVTREEQRYHSVKGPASSALIKVSFGPFNTPLVIQQPSKGGSI
ncbi:MAG: hypothetical protein NVSMB52_06070 [Chloroflexota bacterium]